MTRTNRKCTVAHREVTLEDVSKILELQKNEKTPNTRKGDEDAFSKTLRGSKVYLKEHGLLD